MESQPQNPEFRNNPENFHPCGPRGDKTCLQGLRTTEAQTNCSVPLLFTF